MTINKLNDFNDGVYGADKKINDCNCYIDLILKYYKSNSDYVDLKIEDFDIDNTYEDTTTNEKVSVEDVYKYLDKSSEQNDKENETQFNLEKMLSNFNSTYKYDELKNIEPKLSVTMIKEQASKLHNSSAYYDDANTNEIELESIRKDGTEIGNSYHKFMENFDYRNIEDIDKNNLDSNISIDDIIKFCETDLGKRMKVAYKNKKLYREHKFMKLFSLNELEILFFKYIFLNIFS